MKLSIITINRNNAAGLEKTEKHHIEIMLQEDLYTEFKPSFNED